jgi:hypothetical protein
MLNEQSATQPLSDEQRATAILSASLADTNQTVELFVSAEETGVNCFDVFAGLQDFSWYNIPKHAKIYKMPTKYTKWP